MTFLIIRALIYSDVQNVKNSVRLHMGERL